MHKRCAVTGVIAVLPRFFMNSSNSSRFYDKSCDVSGYNTIDVTNANQLSLHLMIYNLISAIIINSIYAISCHFSISMRISNRFPNHWNLKKVCQTFFTLYVYLLYDHFYILDFSLNSKCITSEDYNSFRIYLQMNAIQPCVNKRLWKDTILVLETGSI